MRNVSRKRIKTPVALIFVRADTSAMLLIKKFEIDKWRGPTRIVSALILAFFIFLFLFYFIFPFLHSCVPCAVETFVRINSSCLQERVETDEAVESFEHNELLEYLMYIRDFGFR